MDEKQLNQTKKECEELGAKVLSYLVDITDADAVNSQ
jgi:hypothetical protein